MEAHFWTNVLFIYPLSNLLSTLLSNCGHIGGNDNGLMNTLSITMTNNKMGLIIFVTMELNYAWIVVSKT